MTVQKIIFKKLKNIYIYIYHIILYIIKVGIKRRDCAK